MEKETLFNLYILMPVFNDKESVGHLMGKLDAVLDISGLRATVVIIDDGSSEPLHDHFLNGTFKNIYAINIIYLHRNLGHQRAIAAGLTHIHDKYPCDAVLVMDADGEDKPEDVPRLIQSFQDNSGTKIIFAERVKRSESMVFKVFYKIYRVMHYILTGIPVRVGNFSIIPYKALSSLVLVSELWNHYAAAVFSSRVPYGTIQTSRGKRIGGTSKMNFTALVLHGLSAISVFTDIAGVRILLFSLFLSLIFGALILLILIMKITSLILIPSWLSYATVFLLILLLQLSGGCFGMVFFILMNRVNLNFIPKRDCKHFIGPVKRAYTNIDKILI